MTTPRSRWFALLFISIAISLIIVDATIVNVAIPSIVNDLGITSSQVQWVQESYTLVFAALLVLFGTAADRFGRRRVLVIGVAVFTIASILAGLAPTGDLLIAARVLQGVGGAMVLPTTLSIINATFRGRERAIAFAIWGSIIGGMAAAGPLLGGWLTTDFSWRWAFGVNVPFGIIVIIGLLVTATESRAGADRGFDVVGALFSIVTTASLVFALIEGRSYGWWLAKDGLTIGSWEWPVAVSPIPFFFALSIAAALVFVWWSRRRRTRGLSTMIALDLFTIPSFRNGNLVGLVVNLGELGVLFVLPMWVQNVLGFDAFGAGLLLLSLAIGSFLASGMVSALSRRMTPVAIVRAGLVLEIVSITALALVLSPDATWQLLAPLLFFYGMGIGLTSAQLPNVVLSHVPVEQSGQASGTQSTSRQVGAALGIAILGTVLFSTLGTELDAHLAALGIPQEPRAGLVAAVVDSAGAAIPGLGNDPETAPIAEQARLAFSDAARYSSLGAAGFLALGLIASVSLGSGRREDEVAAAAKAIAG